MYDNSNLFPIVERIVAGTEVLFDEEKENGMRPTGSNAAQYLPVRIGCAVILAAIRVDSFWHTACLPTAELAVSAGFAPGVARALIHRRPKATCMRRLFSIRRHALVSTAGALLLGLAGCATVSVTPGEIQRPDPAVAYHAIEAEPTFPAQIAVSDFQFSPSSVTENRSVFHRAIDLFLSSSADERRIAIGRKAAAALAKKTAKRLGQTGLKVARIPRGSDVALPGNSGHRPLDRSE
jgi:hypothetical protein